MTQHRLCYVEGVFAYFTNRPLTEQWGDDWNDAPYEHNAGAPYTQGFGQVVMLAWIGPFVPPSEGHYNNPWSVKEINAGATPWLKTVSGQSFVIMAGVTVDEFCDIVERGGGTIFLPRRHHALDVADNRIADITRDIALS